MDSMSQRFEGCSVSFSQSPVYEHIIGFNMDSWCLNAFLQAHSEVDDIDERLCECGCDTPAATRTDRTPELAVSL